MSEKPDPDRPIIKIIDLTDAINKGIGVKVGPDLVIGPVSSRDNPPTKLKFLREPREWTAEPPQGEGGKTPMQFQITESCGVKQENGSKCRMKLIVARVKKMIFETDENEGGGQLQFKEREVSQWIYCPKHGPFPSGPWVKKDGTWVQPKVEKVVVG